MGESLRTFNYIRAFMLGFILNLVLYIFLEPLTRLWNLLITPMHIISVSTAVVILNALGMLSFVFAMIFVVIVYFRKSKYDFTQAMFFGVSLLISTSVWIWFENLVRTLMSTEGITYGGGIGFWPAMTFLFAPLIIMSVASFLGLYKGS